MDKGTTGDDYSTDVWARAQELAPSFGGAGGKVDSPSPTRPSEPNRPSNSVNLPNATLREGSRGDNVKTMQKSLEKLGFELGAQDGIFGDATPDVAKLLP